MYRQMLQGYLSTTSLRVPTRINKITTYYNILQHHNKLKLNRGYDLQSPTRKKHWPLKAAGGIFIFSVVFSWRQAHRISNHGSTAALRMMVFRLLFHELVLLQEGRCSCSHAETTNVQAALLGFFAPWQAEDVFCNLSQGAMGCTMLRLMIWGKFLSFWPLCGRKKRLT